MNRSGFKFGRFGLLVAVGTATAVWVGAAQAHPVARPLVQPSQEVATLLSPHEAYSRPARNAAPIELVRQLRPITGERTILPVLGHAVGGQGVKWLRVRLPGRPNSHTGWIKQASTKVSKTRWHVFVSIGRRLVTVYQNGHAIRTFSAVVGKPSTPTPLGEFFVEESLLMAAGAPGAPYALALSARSTVFQEFEGGPGQVAFHGLTGIGGTPGTAVSHGCIRLDNSVMAWLAQRVGPGVPVTIRG